MSGRDRWTEAETRYTGRRFTTATASVAHQGKRAALVSVEQRWVACARVCDFPRGLPASLLTASLSFLEPLPVMNISPISHNVVLFNPGISWELILAQLAYG